MDGESFVLGACAAVLVWLILGWASYERFTEFTEHRYIQACVDKGVRAIKYDNRFVYCDKDIQIPLEKL